MAINDNVLDYFLVSFDLDYGKYFVLSLFVPSTERFSFKASTNVSSCHAMETLMKIRSFHVLGISTST